MTLEELQQQILDLQEEQKTLKQENENIKNEIVEKDQKINGLQEINQKLFLKVTSKATNDDDDQEEEYQPKLIDKSTYDLLSDEMKEYIRQEEEGIN